MGELLQLTAQTPLGIVALVVVIGCLAGYIVLRSAGQSVRLGLLFGILIGVVLFTYAANDAKNERNPHLQRQQSLLGAVS